MNLIKGKFSYLINFRLATCIAVDDESTKGSSNALWTLAASFDSSVGLFEGV